MIFCSFRFNLVTTFCGCVAFATDIIFNATETVHLSKDSIVLSCSMNPAIHVVQLYFIKLSLLHNNNEWRGIIMLVPRRNNFDLNWIDDDFRDKMQLNTSKTENGVLWVKIPVEKVIHNDSGTFRCFAKWHGSTGVSSSNATKTIEVIEFSSVPHLSTTEPYNDLSYQSSISETTIERTDPGYTTTISGSNALQSNQGEKGNRKGESLTLILGVGLAVLIALTQT